jgi:hypothetical protein
MIAIGHTECAIASLPAAHQVLNNSRRLWNLQMLADAEMV